MRERLSWKKDSTVECMQVDGVVFLNDCVLMCNDGTTSLGGRSSLVVADEGQLRRR